MAKQKNPITAPPRNNDPCTGAAAITPGTNPLPYPTRAIYVGSTGDLNVVMYDDANPSEAGQTGTGTATLFKAVPAGTWLWICVAYVLSANTTATNILGLY